MKRIRTKDKIKLLVRMLVFLVTLNTLLSIGLIIVYFSWDRSVGVGMSMEPTIHDGGTTLSTKLFFNIEKGDIINANPINDGNDYQVQKRVVATEGDHVYMHDGHLYINGIEDTIDPNAVYDSEIDLIIPEDCYYIMGDNRNYSKDSRSYGYITEDEIVGKVIKIYTTE